MKQTYVSVVKKEDYNYPKAETLFRPGERYPEYSFEELAPGKNEVYDSVRQALHLLKLDEEHYGTAAWDPLGQIVRSGDCVLVKPNLVMDVNADRAGNVECLYTQPGVVAAVVDYVLIALHGSGRVVIGDAPMQECDFERLVSESGYDRLTEYYQSKGHDVQLADLRGLRSKVRGGVHYALTDETIPAKVVRMDQASEFSTETPEHLSRMRVTNYDPRIMYTHHNEQTHEYMVSDYLLQADVIINMPKPKSHRKAGLTAALKNLVGINARKEYLPHHTNGAVPEEGDEYLHPSGVHALRSRLYDRLNILSSEGKYAPAAVVKMLTRCCAAALKVVGDGYAEGSWYGNHTISRTIADLNKIVFYADKNGVLQDRPVRRMFIVADMVIAGEGEGPVAPTAKKVGIIAAGENPVCFDEAICTLMGFDTAKIPTLERVRSIQGTYRLVEPDEEPVFVSNDAMYDGKTPAELPFDSLLHFIPTAGWKGHIEISK